MTSFEIVKTSTRRFATWMWPRDDPSAAVWRNAPVTSATVGILTLLFVMERLSGPWHYSVTNLRHAWGYSFPEVANGQVWRLVTAGLLHSDTSELIARPYGLSHLLGNLAVLIVVGPRLERCFGARRAVVLFIVLNALGYGLTVTLDAPFYFGIGASASLAGVTGLLLADGVKRRDWPTVALATAVAVFAYAVPAPHNGVTSNDTHFCGFVAGFILAWIISSRLPTAAFGARVGLFTVAGLLPLAVASIREVHPVVAFDSAARELRCTEEGPYAAPTYADPTHGFGEIEFVNSTHQRLDVYQLRGDGRRDVTMALYPGDRIEETAPVGLRYVVAEVHPNPRLGPSGGCFKLLVVSRGQTVARLS